MGDCVSYGRPVLRCGAPIWQARTMRNGYRKVHGVCIMVIIGVIGIVVGIIGAGQPMQHVQDMPDMDMRHGGVA